MRMSRLKASAVLTATPLNRFLMEFTPSNRVISGDVIVFQNDMLEIFREMVATSRLSSKYVQGIIIEFMRSLAENQIPQ